MRAEPHHNSYRNYLGAEDRKPPVFSQSAARFLAIASPVACIVRSGMQLRSRFIHNPARFLAIWQPPVFSQSAARFLAIGRPFSRNRPPVFSQSAT